MRPNSPILVAADSRTPFAAYTASLGIVAARDIRGDQSNLLLPVEIFGTLYHLNLVRVVRGIYGIWQAEHEDDADLVAGLERMYDYPFETIKIPDLDGDYLAAMHPYGT